MINKEKLTREKKSTGFNGHLNAIKRVFSIHELTPK
jgi:hypothetical protein